MADRGPRDLLDIASPDQIKRYVLPVLRGEADEARAITEPDAAGSDLNEIQATAVRDRDEWRLSGEKWFVTGVTGRTSSFTWAEGEQTLFIVDRDAPGLELMRTPRFMHDPYICKHVEPSSPTAAFPSRTASCRVDTRGRNAGSWSSD